MSVTLDRFVRVMSGGTVVTDQLVQIRFGKAQQGLDAVKAQLARVTQAGLELNPLFVNQVQGLEQGLAAALQRPNNQAKCDALEPLKDTLRRIAGEIPQAVDGLLAAAVTMRQAAADALTAANRANQAIQQITDAAFSGPLGTRLADVQNRRIAAQGATRLAQVQAATTQLGTCVTDATAIAVDAVRVGQQLAARVGRLTEIGNALGGLATVNNTIAEPLHKNAADAAHAGLAQRRDALANAGPNTLGQELSRVQALLAAIATERTKSNDRVAWSNTKARRDVIRKDAVEYEAAGKRENLPALETGGAKLKDNLDQLEAGSVVDPKVATAQLPRLEVALNNLRTQFKDIVARSQLVKKVADLVLSNPGGPEDEMQQALGTDLNGDDVFQQRLLAVYGSARFQGSPEINLLTPGEAVAINTYTTNDYKQMNGYLFGKNPLDPPDPPLKPPTEDQIKLKNKQTAEALKKLPVWTGGITRRGSGPFPNDDAEFALNNVFTIKAFWSTDKKKPFPGKWQLWVDGSTGKNIAMMSAYPKEDEVLFAPGTKFKVMSRDETNPLSIKLIVKEV